MFSSLFSKDTSPTLQWHQLTSFEQLDDIEKLSHKKPVLLFKHSTRCGISAMALSRFERSFRDEIFFEPYFLDLLAFRMISDEVAARLTIPHESPQAILIFKGKSVMDMSHNGIDFDEINEVAKNYS